MTHRAKNANCETTRGRQSQTRRLYCGHDPIDDASFGRPMAGDHIIWTHLRRLDTVTRQGTLCVCACRVIMSMFLYKRKTRYHYRPAHPARHIGIPLWPGRIIINYAISYMGIQYRIKLSRSDFVSSEGRRARERLGERETRTRERAREIEIPSTVGYLRRRGELNRTKTGKIDPSIQRAVQPCVQRTDTERKRERVAWETHSHQRAERICKRHSCPVGQYAEPRLPRLRLSGQRSWI